jgi:hypothetical protein
MATKKSDLPGYPSTRREPVMPPAERQPAVAPPKAVPPTKYVHPANRKSPEA